MSKQSITTAPEGLNSVNPVIISDKAVDTVKFIIEVFGGAENEDVRTYDDDGTIIHSEVKIDNTTLIVADRKDGWPFTPAFTQIYVSDIESVIDRALSLGSEVVTKPTEYVGVNFARVQDPQGNMWWIWQSIENYDWEAAFDGADEESWKPTEEAVYIHDSLVAAMERLAKK